MSVSRLAIALLVAVSAFGTTRNVTSFGATGNGTTNDTAAIQSAIAALVSGDTLLFPCVSANTYKVTSLLFINVSNITVDGSCGAKIAGTATTVMVIGGIGNGAASYGSAIALNATASELATSFTTVSSLGAVAGDYVSLQQGGKDSSTGSGDTACDVSGCRGEVVKVASVSGNTYTITTALHDTYSPSVNAATAKKILNPVKGITVQNLTVDGSSHTATTGLVFAGVGESTVSGVTGQNVKGSAIAGVANFGMNLSGITVTSAGSSQCGNAVFFQIQGNLSMNGVSISNENAGSGVGTCGAAFGLGLYVVANSTISNVTVDSTGALGRGIKLIAARYNTFNSVTAKNGSNSANGLSLEYYSSHNTFNNCVSKDNAGVGGNSGITLFGNFNQFNTFNNCTVTGNGNAQFVINNSDALGLAADSNNTINGGTYCCTAGDFTSVLSLNGSDATVKNATITCGASTNDNGIVLNGANADIEQNSFSNCGSGRDIYVSSGLGTLTACGNSLPNGTTPTISNPPCATPVISSFSASPSSISSGSSSTLSWTVSGATSLSINNGVGVVTGTSTSVSPVVTTTYTLTASNGAGSVTASTTVTITAAGPGHAYWRLYLTGSGGGATTIAEWKVYDPTGTQIATTGGTASASSSVGGLGAANAFDANTATKWASTANATAGSPQWLQYQFASNADVRSSSITIRSDSNLEQAPRDAATQYSDDGSSWTTQYQYYGINWTTLGQTQTLTAANAAPVLAKGYRLLITANGGFAGSASVAEWKLYDAGGRQITTDRFAALSSSVVATETDGGFAAFDADISTYWASNGTASGGSPEWIAYEFSTFESLASFSIKARNSVRYDQAPGTFDLQYTFDGTTWITLRSYTAAPWTSAGQVQTFSVGGVTGFPMVL